MVQQLLARPGKGAGPPRAGGRLAVARRAGACACAAPAPACGRRRGLLLRACAEPAPGGGGGAGGGADNTTATLASWLRRQRVLLNEPEPSDNDILVLSVGGSVMVTSRSTLRQVPGSLLALLFDPANERLLLRDAAGRVFLDHDPDAFGLVLRYLRELRLTAGCSSASELLPAIPPADAATFRSLARHLGLRIEEAAIAAAVARGAAIAAAAGAGRGQQPRSGRPATPYASRPASSSSSSSNGSSCAQLQQQAQWWQEQRKRRMQQQQQQLVRPTLPEQPACRAPVGGAARSKGSGSPRLRLGHGGGGDAARGPQQRARPQQQAHRARGPPQPPPSHAPEPLVQYFHLTTSSPAGGGGGVAPLRVSVQTDGDIAAAAQRGGGDAAGTAGASDVFCSVSTSRSLLSLGLVLRARAALDNVFVGVTSACHVDQRGLQIPTYGWRQVSALPHGSSPGDADAAGVCGLHEQPPQRLWQAGDLVQLLVETGGTVNRLVLKVNGRAVEDAGPLELPAFRHLCFYVALFRGTDVVAIVFEQSSVAVFSGDHKLKRYLT